MLWNHLKIAFRILQKQKLTAAINIIGLGIGLSFFLLLIAYVRDALTFEQFHKSSGQTYILTSEFRDRFLGGIHYFLETYPEMNADFQHDSLADRPDRSPELAR